MKINILDTKGKKTDKSLELNDAVWGLPYNADLVTQVVNVYKTNARAATAHAKNRGEVRGGGRKPWKQKGTGRARAGSSRSPLWVGGGVTFTPSDRNWERKINKKMRTKALAIMLSKRVKDELVSFYGDLDVDRNDYSNAKSVLIVTSNRDVVRKMNNVQGVSVISPVRLNAINVVGAKSILVDAESVTKLEERLVK